MAETKPLWLDNRPTNTYLASSATSQRQSELVIVVAVAEEAARRYAVVVRIDDSLEGFREV